ncbi:MAG: 3-hydroxybutyryl-CoA dehydrogenase [Acidobacteria bacterium]|nr:3-hydroxybutyryl-CoA dehydrogenase [Acidobacteriota bacterium]
MYMEIKKVGVIGCGLMGSGIAQVSAVAGYEVIICEVSQEFLDKGVKGIQGSLAKLVEKGKLSDEDRNATLARLRTTTSLDDLADCNLIIEAIVENKKTKQEAYIKLDQICPPDTILASNTSSLSITELMVAVSPARQKRFVGLHFFNPVPLMKLLEAVRTIVTDEGAFAAVCEYGQKVGKTVVQTRDSSGFIVNRLLVPYLLDAIRGLEEGIGSIEDIDKGMMLGCGHPMGPLTLLDFVGLDTTYYIAEIMFEEFREKRFAAPALLKRMVLAGMNGRKSGRGFYDYSDPKNPKPMKLT